jgi:succinate dehydrogenase hydrophobic anchor subunit
MVSNRPIIGIGPKNSDFAEIITTTNGVFFNYSEKVNLKSVILTFTINFLHGNAGKWSRLQQYSRKNLTKQLVNLIK